MKRHLVMMLCLIAMAASMNAQSISGKLVDEKNEPLAYANVVLLSMPDSTFVNGTISDEMGAFRLTKDEKGQLVRISSIGYATIYKKVNGGDFGVIQMTSDAQLLGEVTVKGTLPTTRLKGDAMITGVTGTLLERAGTAENLLNQIPNVTAQDGSVSVFGRGTPEIYINGRKVRNSSELDQLSSANVKSVEVVNNPGARYDASVKAVIRITTKKQKGEGFGFNNRLYFRHKRGYGLTSLEQFNFNYRKNGFDLGGMLYGTITNLGDDKYLTDHTYLDKHWKQTNRLEQTYQYQRLSTQLSLNYQISDNHTVGIRHDFTRYPKYDWDDATNDSEVYQDDVLTETSHVVADFRAPQTSHRANLYYNGKAGKWSIDLNIDGLWKKDGLWMQNNEHIEEVGKEPWQRVMTTDSKTKNNLYAGKLVLTRPLWKGNLAFGGEYSHNDRTNQYLNPQGILEDDDSRFKEGSTSAFVEYGRSFGKLNLLAGLRYEYVDFKYYDQGKLVEEQSRTFKKLFPSVVLNIPVGKVQMQLSYAIDVERPSYSALRSNITYANRYTYETGNPFLVPSYTNNFILNASYKWISLMAGYQHIEDAIINVNRAYSEENPSVTLLTRDNMPSYDVFNASLTIAPRIGIWRPQWRLLMRKQWYTADTRNGKENLNRPLFGINWQNAIQLPKGILLNVEGTFSTKGYLENLEYPENVIILNMTVQKSFFKNRFNVQLFAYDLLEQNSLRTITYSGIRTMEIVPDSRRQFGMTLRYNFNNTKSKYKGKGAGDSQKARM